MIHRTTRLLAAVLCLLSIPAPGIAQEPEGLGRVHVLSIGINDYDSMSETTSLSFARNDAEVFADLLETRFGYTSTVLVDEDATRERIYDAIFDLQRTVAANDAVIVFFAGHGTDREQRTSTGLYSGFLIPFISDEQMRPSVELQFPDDLVEAFPFTPPPPMAPAGTGTGASAGGSAAADGAAGGAAGSQDPAAGGADGGEMGDEQQVLVAKAAWEEMLRKKHEERLKYEYAVPMAELRSRLQRLPARHVVVFIDACFSGLIGTQTRGAGMVARDDTLLGRYYDVLESSRLMITAGTGDQEALEHNAQTRGYAQLREGDPREAGIEHGVFSYELLHQLERVSADGIGVRQLHQAVRDRVRYVSVNFRGIDQDAQRMTPQLREFPRDDQDVGDFIFIPEPISAWAELVSNAMDRLLASREDIDMQSRGDPAIRAAVLREERFKHRQGLVDAGNRAKLESKALVTLAVQAGLVPAEVRGDLTRDDVWVGRFEEAADRAHVGDGDAMAALYYMYSFGLGTEQNDRLAARWASEAATTGSADAREAFISAIQGPGIEATEEERQRLAAEARRLTPETQASLAAAGAVVAVTQLSGNSNAGKAGGIFAGVLVVGAVLSQQLADAPEASIEFSIASLWESIDQLGQDIRTAERTGRMDRRAYDATAAKIRRLSTRIRSNATRELGMARDTTIVDLTRLSSNQTLVALQTLDRAVPRITTQRGIDTATSAFDDLERSYASLVALLPYIQNDEASWDDG